MRKKGRAEATIKNTRKALNVLAKHADLHKPEVVKGFIAQLDRKNGYKKNLCFAYDNFVKVYNLQWERPNYFPKIRGVQLSRSGVSFWSIGDVPTTRAISGEDYLVLPLKRHDKNLFLPEMSVHFLIMYLLGMISRYHPKEWGETAEGEKSGEIYVIQKFLETTTRKFPNLILNKLWNRDFVFVSPQLEREKRLDREELERIYEYVSHEMAEEIRRHM